MRLSEIKKIDFGDFKAVLYLALAYIPSMIIRHRNPNIWIMCERIIHAEDNAWIFFNWLKSNYPEQKVYFLLDKKADNFDGKDNSHIAWGSIRHYIYFLASRYWLMATFNSPMPNVRVCSRIVDYNRIHKIYLRHGISKDGMEEHRYDIHHFRIFICGAKPEYDYVKSAGGYPEENVKYTGFARFDDLLEAKRDDHFILIIPTWRKYIGVDSTRSQKENEAAFKSSAFYENYIGLIHNQKFIDWLKANNIKARFCLHAEYRRFEKFFSSDSEYIDIVRQDESIHDLLKSTSLLITDYSSVFFDAAYAGKPVIYYHFDYDEFRQKHLKEGYFSYERDGMGPIVHTQEELIRAMQSLQERDSFYIPEEYRRRAERFFPLRDTRNCERIYSEIIKIR